MSRDATNFEEQLFKAADKLRKNIDAAEYKNVALWLIFLKYISESFQELHETLSKDSFSDPEDRDEYIAQNIFYVPPIARRSYIQSRAKLATIWEDIDNAMEAIEKENAELRNVLPKVFGKPNLDKVSLGQLVDLISDANLRVENENSKDLFGRVYEYFLGKFADAEWKRWGQFYTPKSIVKLMVEMIEPYKWRVYDPACGSGGMFVMSEKFVTEHSGNIKDITIYGQESNQTTRKLSRMNLAIRNINSKFVIWNTEWSFLKDAHPDLKADFILANPPFNQSDRWQELLQEDVRRREYGIPPSGNANFGRIQHMLFHLASHGVMATVLANGSLSSNTSWEGEIRKRLVQSGLVECIVALPKQLFYNTWIPACIRILRRGRSDRKTLFIDASWLGHLEDRVHRILSEEEWWDIDTIVSTYHKRRNNDHYEDIKWFCKSAELQDMEKHDYVLTPGRYVGITDTIDDGIPFQEKMNNLIHILSEQFTKEEVMNAEIKKQLAKIGFEM